MIYVDTNVIVAYVNENDPLHETAARLLDKLKDKKLVASRLVVVELYAVYSRVMKVSDVELEALVEYSLEKTGVSVQDVDCHELFFKAQIYAHSLRLKALDLLHVVAASLLGARAIASLDKDIIEKRNVIRKTLGLEVVTPSQSL